jgi:hypothetical protein
MLPSSRSIGVSGWIVVAVTLAVGFVSMIFLLPLFSESDFKSGFGSLSLISTTNDCFEKIHQCCARGFCGNHTTFQCHSLSFPYPYFPVSWTGFQEVVC